MQQAPRTPRQWWSTASGRRRRRSSRCCPPSSPCSTPSTQWTSSTGSRYSRYCVILNKNIFTIMKNICRWCTCRGPGCGWARTTCCSCTAWWPSSAPSTSRPPSPPPAPPPPPPLTSSPSTVSKWTSRAEYSVWCVELARANILWRTTPRPVQLSS